MEPKYELLYYLTKQILPIIVYGTIALIALRFIPAASKIFELFFLRLSPTRIELRSSANEEQEKLKEELKQIKEALSSPNFKEKITEFDLRSYIEKSLPGLVHQKISEISDKSIEEIISDKLKKHDVKAPVSTGEILDTDEESYQKQTTNRMHSDNRRLSAKLERESSSAAATKMVMMNIFILFNISTIVLFLFLNREPSKYFAVSFSGLYISLSAFIIYIYRSANVRSSTILSLQESLVKYHNAKSFMKMFKKESEAFDESDVEVMKLILRNQAEKEKNISHPYELVFKQLSGSNILFKGGKVSIEKKGNG
jgi:hypothetical protein